ncbi:MAG: TrbI F-type domain-containing protein [Verrucomicrobia bacterium]|nr:TrbI F-type domain-containing protein [Verrucomicrobiota bacterium]
MKLNFKFNYTCIITGVLLASLVGNCILSYRISTQIRFAKVDAVYLMQNLVKEISTQNLSSDDLKVHTKKELAKLDQLLEKIAKQENLVLLPSKAVIAGAIDITGQVETIMRQQDESSN